MLSLQLPNWWFQSDDSSILGPIPTFCQSLQCHLLQRPFTTGRQHGTEHDESTVVTSGSTIQEQLTAVEELMTRHLRQTERMVHGSYPGCSLKEPKQNPGWRLPPRVTSSNSGFIENQSWRLNQILKHSPGPGVLLDFCSFLTLLDLHLSRHARITWQFAAIRACQPSQLGLVTLNSSRTILATQTCHVTWYHLILLYFNMLRSRCHIEFHSIFPSNFRQNVYSLSTNHKTRGVGKRARLKRTKLQSSGRRFFQQTTKRQWGQNQGSGVAELRWCVERKAKRASATLKATDLTVIWSAKSW